MYRLCHWRERIGDQRVPQWLATWQAYCHCHPDSRSHVGKGHVTMRCLSTALTTHCPHYTHTHTHTGCVKKLTVTLNAGAITLLSTTLPNADWSSNFFHCQTLQQKVTVKDATVSSHYLVKYPPPLWLASANSALWWHHQHTQTLTLRDADKQSSSTWPSVSRLLMLLSSSSSCLSAYFHKESRAVRVWCRLL